MAATPPEERYRLESVLDRGGMGVVYRARDNTTEREVAIKTLNDVADAAAQEQFRHEFEILSNLKHPNIVDIYDVCEFEGRPGFVMPLLPGKNLATLIKAKELSVERIVDIVSQVCRGLQAAHEGGLVHRDLKPGNIFVLPGDAVKIIDFGIASMVDRRHSLSLRGTILYMAPEQTRLKEATPESDLFSLGVVCYEALAGTHPFAGSTDAEIFEAIRKLIPPPISRINSDVSDAVSQVVHKAMAKQPSLRFSSADDFKICLQKAFRGEPIEYFNESRTQERLSRIRAAVESGSYDLANEILSNLEAEICHPDIPPLRGRIEEAVRSQQIGEFLDNARQRLAVGEYELTLKWIQKVLELEPTHPEGLDLNYQVEQQRNVGQIEDWIRLGRTHLENLSFARAREAVDNALEMNPTEDRATQLRADIDRREQEYAQARKEKEALYREAVRAQNVGELSSALSKLEQIIKLDGLAPDTSSDQHQRLYEEIRSEHDRLNQSITEIRRCRTEKNFDRALELCSAILADHPNHAIVQDLKLTTEADQRQQLHSYIAEVTAQVHKEPDLDRKVSILNEALSRHPDQPDFQRLLHGAEQRRVWLDSIVARAREHEETERFTEGLAQWETLRSVYPQYPGLEFEIDRLRKREGRQRQTEMKVRRVEEIEIARREGDWDRAAALLEDALAEFPDESEFIELRSILFGEKQKAEEAEDLFEKASELLKLPASREEGLAMLERAHEFSPRHTMVRDALLQSLLNAARDAIDSDWKRAEDLVNRADRLDQGNKDAVGIRVLIADRRRANEIDVRLAEVRRLEGSGDLQGALEKARLGVADYPHDKRFLRLQSGLVTSLSESRASYSRQKDLDQIRELIHDAESEPSSVLADSIWQRTQVFAERYSTDSEVKDLVTTINSRLKKSDPTGTSAPSPSADIRPAEKPQNEGTKRNRSAAMAAAIADLQRSFGQLKILAAARRKEIIVGAGGVAAIMTIAIAWYAVARSSGDDVQTGLVADVAAAITTDPQQAEVFVDGSSVGVAPLSLSLPAGEHLFTAKLAGFYDEQVTTTLELATEEGGVDEVDAVPSSVPVHLSLRPMPLALEFDIGVESGIVSLDGEEAIDLGSGSELVIRDVPPGRHLVEFSGAGRTTASFAFDFQPGRAPTIEPADGEGGASLIRAERLRAVVYTGLASNGQLYSSSEGISASFGDAADRPFPILNVSLDSGSPRLKDGTWEREISLAGSLEPVLQVFLMSDRDEGDVYVPANEQDDLIVELDGARLPRYSKRSGQIRLFGLRTGERTLRISKPGFRADPPTQRVTVRKDAVVTAQPVRFEQIPTRAALKIVNGEAGASVSINGEDVGTIAADGTFNADVQPGAHQITFSRRGYVSKTITQQVSSGETVEVAGDAHRLNLATGTILFSAIPPNSSLEYTGTMLTAGRSSPKKSVLVPAELSLPTGTYNLTILAPGSAPWEATVELAEGQRLTVSPKFVAPAAPPPPWSAALADGWTDVGDGWKESTADGISWTPAMPSAGARFSFVIQIPSAFLGKGDPVEWVVSILGSTDRYLRFGVNEKEFLVGGAAAATHNLDGKSEQRVLVEVTSSGIRTSIGTTFSITTPATVDIRSAQFGFVSRRDKPIRVRVFEARSL